MALIAIGEVTVDWLGLNEGAGFQEQELFRRAAGGNASNVACAVSRLGAQARLVGKVGDDLHAEYIRTTLTRFGVDLSYLLTDPGYPTAQCYVTTDQAGEHRYYNWPSPHAAQMLDVREIKPEMFEGGKILHATGVSLTHDPRRQAVGVAMDMALRSGLILSFDCGFPTGEDREARLHFDRAMSMAHLLKVNELELRFWSEGNAAMSLESLAEKMFAHYKPFLLFVTLAEAGSLVVGPDGHQFLQPFPVASTCGVGAGDAFMSGVLFALLNELGEKLCVDSLEKLDRRTLARITLTGNAAGALATRKPGAVESLADRHELDGLLSGQVF